MESRENVKGIAARVAMWSARHRALAILGWLAFVVGVTVLSGQARHACRRPTADQGNGDSGRADRIVEQAGFPEQAGRRDGASSRTGRAADRAAAIAEVTAADDATGVTDGAAAPLDVAGRASRR